MTSTAAAQNSKPAAGVEDLRPCRKLRRRWSKHELTKQQRGRAFKNSDFIFSIYAHAYQHWKMQMTGTTEVASTQNFFFLMDFWIPTFWS